MSIKEKAKEFSKAYNVKVFPLKGKANYLRRLGPDWHLYASQHIDVFDDEMWKEADNYGVTLGELTVIDIDTADIKELELPDLEKTLVVRTGRGFHFYYKGELPSGKNLAAYSHYPIQIKTGKNAYVIGPGSYHHDNQKHYKYLRELPISSFDVKSWIGKLDIDMEADSIKSILSRNKKIKEGNRNTTLTKVLGFICRYDINEATVKDFALSFNKNQIEPPLKEKEVLNTVKSIIKKTAEETVEFSPTDKFIENLITETKEEEYEVFTARQISEWPEPDSLIRGMWLDSAINFLLGRWGSYKSFIALDMAAKMSEGLDIHETHTIEKPLKVLYVAAEGILGFRKRIKAAQFEDIKLDFISDVWSIYPKDNPAFYRLLDKMKYDIVFLDTFQKVRGSFKENLSDDIKKLMGPLDKCHADIGTNFMFVHHKGKGESLFRGSDAIVADAGNVWTLVDKNAKERQITLRSLKLKDLEDFSLRVTLGKCEENDSLYVDSYYNNDTIDIDLESPSRNIIDVTKERVIEAVLHIKTQKDKSNKHALEYLLTKPEIYKLIQKEIEEKWNGEAKVKPIRDIISQMVIFQKIEGRWLWLDWVQSSG